MFLGGIYLVYFPVSFNALLIYWPTRLFYNVFPQGKAYFEGMVHRENQSSFSSQKIYVNEEKNFCERCSSVSVKICHPEESNLKEI